MLAWKAERGRSPVVLGRPWADRWKHRGRFVLPDQALHRPQILDAAPNGGHPVLPVLADRGDRHVVADEDHHLGAEVGQHAHQVRAEEAGGAGDGHRSTGPEGPGRLPAILTQSVHPRSPPWQCDTPWGLWRGIGAGVSGYDRFGGLRRGAETPIVDGLSYASSRSRG